MIALLKIVLEALSDLAWAVCLSFRRQGALAAEFLMLRRQLAMYVERGVKPRQLAFGDGAAAPYTLY